MNWYEKAFSKNYLDVYEHRTDEQAQAEVLLACKLLKLNKEKVVLDLCCGSGRHVFALSPFVKFIVGYDLSLDLLNCAVKNNNSKKLSNIFWQKGDMRHLGYRGTFDAIVNFFNSFGYFADEMENLQVIKNIFNALKPKGVVLIDLMNKPFIINNMVPQSEKKINQFLINEKRALSNDGLRVEKHVKIYQDNKLVNEYQESVRMYTTEELSLFFKAAGFSSLQFYGNFEQTILTEASPRLLLIAEKPS